MPNEPRLAAALRRPRTGLIGECKQRSPSAGTLREGYDAAALAGAWADVADAISVLTDGPRFGGSLDDLRRVRDAVDLPLLRKDFLRDPEDVRRSKVAGADAVLLILADLDDAAYAECAAAAAEAGLEVLTEAHTESELERGLALGARILGINNRDLRTLHVDLDVFRRLAPRVPADRLVVCESGIATRRDVVGLRALADGFLIGTALMRAGDPAAAARRLVYGEVKICGLTRAEDARAAWETGASWGGLVFAAESPRRVDLQAARAVRRAAPLRFAGVFVNAAPATVAGTARDLALDAVQLHGEEDAAYVRRLRRGLPPRCEIWKAVRVRDRVPRRDESGADRIVLDAWDPDRRGGSGSRFDWGLLRGAAALERSILAGGIGPENVGQAERVGAGILDVGSGVEEHPGRKSRGRLEALFSALRGPGRDGR